MLGESRILPLIFFIWCNGVACVVSLKQHFFLLYNNRELPTFPTKAQAVILDSTSIICSLATAPTSVSFLKHNGFNINVRFPFASFVF
jgi:hypothetical protein